MRAEVERYTRLMDDLFPGTRHLSIPKAQEELSALVEAVNRRESRVVLERDGEAVAAIVSLWDLERILRLQSQMAELTSEMEKTSAAFSDEAEEGVVEETLRIIQEQRAERRAEEKLAALAIPPHMQRHHLANSRY